MPKYENSSAERISADLWEVKMRRNKKRKTTIEHEQAYFAGCAQTVIPGQII